MYNIVTFYASLTPDENDSFIRDNANFNHDPLGYQRKLKNAAAKMNMMKGFEKHFKAKLEMNFNNFTKEEDMKEEDKI